MTTILWASHQKDAHPQVGDALNGLAGVRTSIIRLQVQNSVQLINQMGVKQIKESLWEEKWEGVCVSACQ